MKLCLSLFLLASLIVLGSSDKWAVLVAGSNTYSNYRHQSDVFNAYHLLKSNGFDESKIITFAYDDIAQSSRNPFKGKVFNKPTYKEPGVDVYEGVKIDYKGKDVDPAVFLEVLEGNKDAVKSKGTGRVLESTSDDEVFLYFADHGAPGLIAFPSKYLYATQLLPTFEKMRGNYKKLVFYLEACESGSMFTKLPNDTKIYALSAANPSESSWGYYCSPQDVVGGKHIGSCLGDLFSINFLETTYAAPDLTKVSLTEHFEMIKKLTTKSHVMQWGDLSFQQDSIAEYMAGPSVSSEQDNGILMSFNNKFRNFINSFEAPSMIDSRMMKVKTLAQIYAREKTS